MLKLDKNVFVKIQKDKKKTWDLCDKLQEPRRNENKIRAKQLGVPVTFYYADTGHVFAEGHRGQAQSKPGLNQHSSPVLLFLYDPCYILLSFMCLMPYF